MGLSIQDLGALGEFIGAFGVVASLIYVGLQIKQTTKRGHGRFRSEIHAISQRNVSFHCGESPHHRID